MHLKKMSLTLMSASFILGITFLSCTTSEKKQENIQNSDTNKRKDTLAQPSYINDMDTFRKQILDTIRANDQIIANFKVKIEHEKIQAKVEYKKKVDKLEQKNRELEKKIDEYAAEGKEKWKIFKKDFTQQIDTLGKEIKDLVSRRK